MYQLFFIPKEITGSILTLLQYTMTLLQGPKYTVLPTLRQSRDENFCWELNISLIRLQMEPNIPKLTQKVRWVFMGLMLKVLHWVILQMLKLCREACPIFQPQQGHWDQVRNFFRFFFQFQTSLDQFGQFEWSLEQFQNHCLNLIRPAKVFLSSLNNFY